jgi:DedD protein
MALPSFFKRKASTAPAAPAVDPLSDEAGPVQAARAQARRRLIGAVVLLAVGVVVFPMLFETQPRPLAKDIPIELPKRDVVAPPAAGVPRATPAVTELPVPEPAAPASAALAEAATPAPTQAEPSAITVPASTASAPVAAALPKQAASASSAARLPASAAKSEPPRVDPRKAESERARAALEGRGQAQAAATPGAASDARSGRFVVQVGAYTDAATLREVRAKVEKLGLKTYTQSVDTEAGKRTRVRVGPFATKQEAENASSKLKGAGLPGNVLVL